MIILGIESSCDETSVALLECSDDGFVVLAEKTQSQIDVHKKYGGVVPEIAGRQHAENVMPVVESVLDHENMKTLKHKNKPDVIAVTAGPGLVTGLVVGVEAAKTLSYLWNVPLVAVNHIEGHIFSVLLKDTRNKSQDTNNNQFLISNFQFPAICLIVSGGHTELILMKNHGDYELIGKTRDDAAGECFDKVGKWIGIDYPAGPIISKMAETGNPNAIPFPRPMLDSNTYEFSFAGLKTAALYWLRDNAKKTPIGYELLAMNLNDFCASFEQAIVDVLVVKTMSAAKQFHPKTIILGGGVSANKKLRNTLFSQSKTLGYELLAPNQKYSTDNGAMIAAAAYHHAKKKEYTSWRDISVDPNWKVYAR